MSGQRFDPRREAYEALKVSRKVQRGQGAERSSGAVGAVHTGVSGADVLPPLEAAETSRNASSSKPARRSLCAGGASPHPRWAYQGTDLSAAREGWCERPQRFMEVNTGETYARRCGASRASKCGPCARLKRGDISAIGRSGWMDQAMALAFFVTLTAPGRDVLPFDRALCSHSDGVVCSGELGCVIESGPLARWHDGIGLRWSHFVQDVRRTLGPAVSVEFFKTWEPQERGALHAHAMVRVEGVCSARRFREVVKDCSRRQGFGTMHKVDQIDVSDSRTVAKVAGYCASYCSKSAEALPMLETLSAEGVTSVCGVRSWSASRRWGDSMASVKARRCAWAMSAHRARAGASPGSTGGAGAAVGGPLDLNTEIYASDLRVAVCSASGGLSPV